MPCATPALTYQERLELIQSAISAQTASGFSVDIPIHFIIITDEEGNSDWNIPGISLNQRVSQVNEYFTNDMNFYICAVTRVADNDLLIFNGNDEWQELWDVFHDEDAISIYLVNEIVIGEVSYGGITFLPNNPLSKIVVVARTGLDYIIGHELGHYFGMEHTFDGDQFVNSPVCWAAWEFKCNMETLCMNPGCGECKIAGDGFCDTPADPGTISGNNPNGCSDNCDVPECNINDPLGVPYNPDKQNLMSYYTCSDHHLSAEQLNRAWQILNNHENRIFLLTATPDCEPVLPDFGRVERACNDGVFQVDPMELVKVKIENITTEFENIEQTGTVGSSLEGKYRLFRSQLYGGEDHIVKVKPFNEDVYNEAYTATNGVTVLDLVQIRSHILGIQNIPNKPYGWIAADVNFSGTITTLDMILIRKVILAIDNNFEHGSWRFVPAYYLEPQFEDFHDSFLENPFTAVWDGPNGDTRPYLPASGSNQKSYMDEFEINLQDFAIENENSWSFRAIKTGDVNCNAEVDFPFTGGEDQYILTVPQHNCLEASETAILYLIGKSSDNISAYQLGFTFDKTAMEIQGISKGDLSSFTLDNFGLTKLDQGELRTIWLDDNAASVDLTVDKTLFKVHVKFLQRVCDLSQVIQLDDKVMMNRVFDEDGIAQEATLRLEVTPKTIKHDLRNIYPNPFTNTVTFEFELDSADDVTIRIADYFGNSQLSEENYPAGISSCVLQNVSNLQGGVIYYIVHLGDEIHTGNLVKVE